MKPNLHCKKLPALLGTTLLTAFLLSACSSNVPTLIRQAPADQPRLQAVLAQAGQYRNARVRWGGEIVRVDNLRQSTLIEILARPLTSDGEPLPAQGEGRFIARFPGFVDPMRYPKERALTVTGTLAEAISRDIGAFSYRYPVVDVIAHHLWPEPVRYPPPGYLWDPYPWYPFHHPPYPRDYWW